MSDTPKIEPAMTPEEWTELFDPELYSGGAFLPLKPDECTELYDHPHAMAACALYGQPFGFTREDVEVLRIARDAGRIEGGLGGEPVRMAGRPLRFGEQLRLKEIADRIEALLPPEP
jgi:hypothetical protein